MTIDSEISKILDDIYKIGVTDELMKIDDYATLKPGIMKKLDQLIEAKVREARHEQRHQPLGVSRWIAVGKEHGYWSHPMVIKQLQSNQEGK